MGNFGEPSAMPSGPTETGSQKGYYMIPSHGQSHNATPQTENVHIVIFDSLLYGKMVMAQPTPDPGNFVCDD